MAGEYVYTLEDLTKQHGAKTILTDVNLSFFFGARIGVIGGNGSGKSSLLKIMAGLDTEYIGQCHIAKNTKMGYLEQEPLLSPGKTVKEVVMEGVEEQQAKLDRYDKIWELLGGDVSDEESDKLNNEVANLQEEIDANNLWELDRHVELAMDALRLPESNQCVDVLSGGEKRRVAICRLLLQNPDVLLLDEPTNHLDAESVGWLEEHLKRFTGTLIVVTHDRYFLSNVTEWILELDAGRAFPYKGNYEAWLEQKQTIAEKSQKLNASRKKLLRQELEWVRMNASSRLTKNKARLKRYDELSAQEFDTREENLSIQIPHGRRLGNKVVQAKDLSKAFGDQLLFEGVNFDLPPGGIVGIIGGNGAGKTTLFKMINGKETPTSGSLELGNSVDISYVDQLRDDLDPDKTIWEEISKGEETIEVGGREMSSRAYCARFNFKGAEQQKKVGVLSGGERNRVHLAKLLRSGGNLLLLDEPTNDLDVATLRSLEEGLMNFGGCAVVISHDRWFLDRVATHILAFEGNSEAIWFEGNYQTFQEHMRKQNGDNWSPHRVRYRPIKNG
ncbi:energy-dependent translational throttle protein EttA [Pontiella sulfatireligans]|uniref:Energy-dependent translational throttle protein EttA n=1 Tax=Pontiella sulfatireligans TaxID=2750658 RepID=A0A6C2UMN4_9BACT|nr:energy-dependent translational throttle protein EttA [Pontiella sulfatireligans]VGO20366.1 Energy-dependent translational throttle protein EttA [Pontiella sulfatireligans]